jgi:hypothetical protein
MRKTWRLAFLLLSTISTMASHAQQQSTGLQFLDRKQYDLLPRAKAPVGGSSKELPDSATLENYFPTAQSQGLDSNACAAFAVTSNKAYRIFMASGQKGSPNDYLQSPGFPYSAACQRRVVTANNECKANTLITDELDFMSEIGSIRLADMPYRTHLCEDWRSHLTEGKNKSSAPYTALPGPPNGKLALSLMKNLLAGGEPIIVGINACGEFRTPIKGYVKVLDPDDRKCSPHAVLVVGYDSRPKPQLIRILNSWGDEKEWKGSDHGKVWMSEDVFLERYMEGYVDQGPGQVVAFAGSYTALAQSQLPISQPSYTSTTLGSGAPPPVQGAPSFLVTPEILKAALRSNIGARVGTRVIVDPDDGTSHTVNKRYLWLDLPEQYADQVQSVSYTLKHSSFPHPYTTSKEKSSIFLVWWKGYNCVDEASVTANLRDPSLNQGKPVVADFNYCSLDDTQRPPE